MLPDLTKPHAGRRRCDPRGREIERASAEFGTVRRNLDRIEGRRSANEQAIELGATERHVRDHFGNEDLADQRALGIGHD